MNKSIDYGFKILLLAIGLADFFGVLPDSLDLVDKVLTSAILVYFWLRLSPTKFTVGKKVKWLDWTILLTFYILVIDTFVPFIADLINITPDLGFKISLYSLGIGSVLLLLISSYICSKVSLSKPSVVHALSYTIDKKERLWNLINKNIFVRFAFVFLILFAFSQFLFGLVNQWFIVSLDKSLLVVAVIFAIKDLERSKVKVLQNLGSFDDLFLNKVAELFTSTKFYLGIGFLLIFHYLSDIGTFFIPYLLNVAKEPYYFAKLGAENLHLNLIELLNMETVSGFQGIAAIITYIFSGAGMLFLLLIPIMLCFFIVFKVDIKKFSSKPYAQLLIAFVCVCVITFMIAPWSYQQAIVPSSTAYQEASGVIGVDFLTKQISQASLFDFTTTFIIVAILFLLFLFFRKSKEYLLTFASFTSLVFLGIFAWNFFRSAFHYYFAANGAITFFISNSLYYHTALLYVLFFLDLLFYLGGFLLFTYFTCKYLVNNTLSDLLDNKLIIGWSFGMILIAMILLAFTTTTNFSTMTVVLFSFLITGFLFNLSFYRALIGEKEYRDDLVLAIGIVVFLFLFFGILGFFLQQSMGIEESLINMYSPVVVAIASLFLVSWFKLKANLKELQIPKFLISVGLGIVFGFIFYVLNEPITVLPASIFAVVFGTLFISIAEENMFRLVILKLAEKAFGFQKAQILQSLAFALIHFLFVLTLFSHYGNVLMFSVYFAGLFVFALLMGLLMGRGEKSNILYPILCHWITNIITFAMLL